MLPINPQVLATSNVVRTEANPNILGPLPTAPAQNGARKGAHFPRRLRYNRRRHRKLALWIDKDQIERLTGYPMDIYVIKEGRVLPYILDPEFSERLPVIPPEITKFEFKWRGAHPKRYRYEFDRLESSNLDVMGSPSASLPLSGKLPRRTTRFSLSLPCLVNVTGTARVFVGLRLTRRNGRHIPGTPIRVTLVKRCAPLSDECETECENGGLCVRNHICWCPRGFYGPRCQLNKCSSPCLNGGKCRGVNRCRCQKEFAGPRCERPRLLSDRQCGRRCKKGRCVGARCVCNEGYRGRWCGRKRRRKGPRVWI